MSSLPDRPGPRWSLPDDPSLEWLRKRAKRLRRRVLEADPEAIALVEAYDPPAGSGPLTIARAQRVLARAFGFVGWARLREHLAVIEEHRRVPGPPTHDDSPADRFLRLACLGYSRYTPDDTATAERLLADHPGLATDSVWTMAACGRYDDLAAALADRPELAVQDGGPHRWAPLLYLAYARLDRGRGDPVAAARVLLSAGADPNAGFLWHGLTSPFTALTGAFGGGERGEPAHPDALPLARVLLEAGADPNDNQTLYNRMFTTDDSHLVLLFDFGLGEDRPSPWRRRLGSAYPGPEAMVGEQLRHAAQHGMLARTRLLLAHGVDPDTVGYHPIHRGQSAYELAVRAGQTEAARLMVAAGASEERIDAVDRLLAAGLSGDEPAVRAAVEADPSLAARAARRRPATMADAVEHSQLASLPLLLDLGFDVNGARRDRRTALHHAALQGDQATVLWLLEHGADPSLTDREFASTPAGWAEHAGHQELALLLAARR